MDILDKLEDLHKKATTERSHYYVASCCKEAINEIRALRERLEAIRLASMSEAQRDFELNGPDRW